MRPIATPAGLLHPLFTTKALERRRLFPQPSQATVPHTVEFDSRKHARSMTRQRPARRIDEHQFTAPASHARFGILCVVIGHDRVDANLSGETLFGLGHYLDSSLELR